MKRILILLLVMGVSSMTLIAQGFSGSWYGRGESRAGMEYNTYLSELIIQKKGDLITGVLNYYFGQHEYSVKISGKYWARTKTIELDPFKLITFFAKDSAAPECTMDGSLTMYISGSDTSLYGQLNPLTKYRYGCPIVTISLLKAHQPIAAKKLIPNPGIASSAGAETASPTPVAATPQPEMPLFGRAFLEGQLIEVSTDSITLHLYDNGKIDYDTVSVYFNRKQIVTKRLLGLKPIEIFIVLQPGMNEIALFAENLGEIPPNTALCIVYAGTERFDVNLSSTLATNGTIRIRRKE